MIRCGPLPSTGIEAGAEAEAWLSDMAERTEPRGRTNSVLRDALGLARLLDDPDFQCVAMGRISSVLLRHEVQHRAPNLLRALLVVVDHARSHQKGRSISGSSAGPERVAR